MKNLSPLKVTILSFILSLILLQSCSKGGGGTTTPADPCAGKTITVTPVVTQIADPCSNNGIVTVSATGSTGFTFNIDAGAFQATGLFNNLAPGNHNLSVKDAAGCVKTGSVNVPALAAGTLFTIVKTMMQTNCAVTGCHNGVQSPNFTSDCNIVANWNLIKARAVDAAGTSNQMPQPPLAALPQADKDKITNWVNAGHRLTD